MEKSSEKIVYYPRGHELYKKFDRDLKYTHIHCKKCSMDKLLSDFHFSKRKLMGINTLCRICTNRYSYADRCQKVYGLNNLNYMKLLTYKKGCWICGCDRDLVIDHCHKSSKVRGLLCNICNKGIGCLKDNIKILNNAKQYLLDNGKKVEELLAVE